MKIFLFIGIVIIVIICFFIVYNRLFYNNFMKQAEQICREAGNQNTNLITKNDLKELPVPVAPYLRFSGLVGKKKIGSMRIVHSGSFKPGANRTFLPIRGEYFLTTKKPSFCWYGKISLIPGFTFSALEQADEDKKQLIIDEIKKQQNRKDRDKGIEK